MKLYPFYTAITHLKEFFDITLTDDEFETIGMHAWDKINTRVTRTYRYTGTVCDGRLSLPCNVDIIEAVYGSGEDYQRKDNVATEYYGNLETESYIASRSGLNTSDLFNKGRLIKYSQADGDLIIPGEDRPITIIYKGEVLDENGLPSINYKQVEAIATYCAYVHTNKKAMATRDKTTFEMAQMLRQSWQRLCDDARTPIHLSQNEMNEILDAMTSWDRKRFGISYKPLT